MPLQPGLRLGPYEIVAPLGAGGMGEVYKARDTRLDRTVAIKILPETLAADPQFRERFDREARAISQLTHPHICTLYDVGEHAGTAYLVMEYLEGETLEHRLQKGALSLDQALKTAIEVASALDKAHRAGIVHRDLKPGNIMLTKSGAKLLDFGLAKSGAGVVAGAGLSMLPTTPPNLTAHGTILGTFQYMAPEQLEGQEADARTDLFAFGAVLYEMLTGRKAFEGKSQASVIAAILEREPPAVSSAQPLAPSTLDRLVKKCVAKDPDDRWQTARDLLDELKWMVGDGSGAEARVSQSGFETRASLKARRHLRSAWSAAALFLTTTLVAVAVGYAHRSLPDPQVFRTSLALPVTFRSDPPSSRLAVSPDGRRLAIAGDANSRVSLWVRSLDGLGAQPLAGTEGATAPFWSPNSRTIAFYADGKLKKIDASGGPALTLCDVSLNNTVSLTGAWNRDDVILFVAADGSVISRVAAAGGTPSPVTTLNAKAGETRHAFPSFLPDGRHFIYVALNGIRPLAVYVGALDSSDRTQVLAGGSNAQYAQGYLLFLRDSTLMAQPFDTAHLRLSSEAVPVAEQIIFNVAAPRGGAFSASANGVLVYETGTPGRGSVRLAWVDRSGNPAGTFGDLALYRELALSPDGSRAAVGITPVGGPSDIWIFDLKRELPARLTFGPASALSGVWSPDGTRIAFRSNRKGRYDLYEKASNGVGTESVVFADNQDKLPVSWSPDGRFLLYGIGNDLSETELWVLPLTGDRKPFPYLQSPSHPFIGQFSPDGHWVAFTSRESGTVEVYVAAFPNPAERWRISTSGGTNPRWRRDGNELFYTTPAGAIMAAAVGASGARVEVGTTRALFVSSDTLSGYAVSPDGQRFLTFKNEEAAGPPPTTLVVNWPALVKK
jgi:serine/threonine protein kinase/Tol biopolymer transport system component